MEAIIQNLEKLSLTSINNNNTKRRMNQTTTNNMDNNFSQKRFVMENLKLIHPFCGKKDDLAMYVGAIENIIPNITSLPSDDRILFFNCILQTLSGAALDAVRREQPEDWTSLKKLLIMEFGEHENITHLILSINSIRFRGNIKKLCEEINILMCRIRDAIKLCNETEERKKFFINEVQFYSLKTLKKELPNHLTALLNANLVDNFQTAIQTLKESGEFNENIHYKSNNNRIYGQQQSQQLNSNRIHINRSIPPQDNRYFNRNHNTNQNFYPQNFYPNEYQNRHQNFYPQNSFNKNPQHNDRRSNNYNPNKRMREYDSNQSRIRKYGAPIPMEVENFHLKASSNYPPFQ